jgi:hypothetical protein
MVHGPYNIKDRDLRMCDIFGNTIVLNFK